MDIYIFFAEDDEHIGNAIKAFLLDADYNVELCPDGQEVLKNFRKSGDVADTAETGRSPFEAERRAAEGNTLQFPLP